MRPFHVLLAVWFLSYFLRWVEFCASAFARKKPLIIIHPCGTISFALRIHDSTDGIRDLMRLHYIPERYIDAFLFYGQMLSAGGAGLLVRKVSCHHSCTCMCWPRFSLCALRLHALPYAPVLLLYVSLQHRGYQ